MSKWQKEMTDTEQYHAQAIDILEDRIAGFPPPDHYSNPDF